MSLVCSLFGGALLVNAVPHGVSGLTGREFPTPFADPPGVGLSSPTLNIVWSAMNLGGAALALRSSTRKPAVAVVGGLAMGLNLASRFGAQTSRRR